jgi:hypothetical protein
VRWSDQPGSKLHPFGYLAGLAELSRIRHFHRRLQPAELLLHLRPELTVTG